MELQPAQVREKERPEACRRASRLERQGKPLEQSLPRYGGLQSGIQRASFFFKQRKDSMERRMLLLVLLEHITLCLGTRACICVFQG